MGGSLILFGAGASFGSDTGATPPIGPCLYNALAAYSPSTWGNILPKEAASLRADFEKGMREFADAHANDGYVDTLQRAMAAYFFSFDPQTTSLYLKLGKRMLDTAWSGAVASLNYERLLECSLRKVGLNVTVGACCADAIELCLPHGCCHLFGKIRTPVPTPKLPEPGGPITGAGTHPSVRVISQGPIIIETKKRADGTEPTTNLVGSGPIDFGHDVRLDSDTIRIIEDPDEHAEELRNSRVPPVMCYFQPDKDTRAGVSFIKAQRERFKKLVGAASTVAIIGVKVREHDAHIWDPLRDTSARIIYCSGKAAGNEFRCWGRATNRKGDEVLPVFWADGFEAICSALEIG